MHSPLLLSLGCRAGVPGNEHRQIRGEEPGPEAAEEPTLPATVLTMPPTGCRNAVDPGLREVHASEVSLRALSPFLY